MRIGSLTIHVPWPVDANRRMIGWPTPTESPSLRTRRLSRSDMRLARLCLGFALAALFAGAAPQEEDDALRIYGVHIDRTPRQPWTGNGIYLGQGIVLTAAHVAGLGIWRWPRVEVDGQDLPTTVLKDGHFHHVDLTLLSVDELQLPVRLGLRRLTLCQAPPWVGEEVIVVNRESAVRSQVISPYLLPLGIPEEFQTVISYDPPSGDSGSGVLDANRKCLLGIISRKIWRYQIRQVNGHSVRENRDIAKYFVPASTIAKFIPPDVHY
jgi:hypothetical protein